MSAPLLWDSSIVEEGMIIRFVPISRVRPVTIVVEHIDWHDSGHTMLQGHRARYEGNELDGYAPASFGNLLTYLAPSKVEAVVPGE